MFEQFEFETLTARGASVILALVIGLAFGVLAQITRFCFRRAIVGDAEDRPGARGVWFMALASAILGTQAAVHFDLIGFDAHRFMTSDVPILAIAIGGLMFGVGMVLTRGCISRLTVLTGTGNTRALVVLLLFALAAHSTMKGVLAPVRTGLSNWTQNFGEIVSFAGLPGGTVGWTLGFAVLALTIALSAGARPLHLALAVLLGLLVPAGWIGTGFILFDEFDPIAMQSLSFTLPHADALFWTIASSSIPAGFGVGLVGGVIAGALASSLLRGEFRWQSFSSPQQTGRYAGGAVLMGVGGTLAGGCTVGLGLSGIPTLSIAAVLGLVFITVGALLAKLVLEPTARVSVTA